VPDSINSNETKKWGDAGSLTVLSLFYMLLFLLFFGVMIRATFRDKNVNEPDQISITKNSTTQHVATQNTSTQNATTIEQKNGNTNGTQLNATTQLPSVDVIRVEGQSDSGNSQSDTPESQSDTSEFAFASATTSPSQLPPNEVTAQPSQTSQHEKVSVTVANTNDAKKLTSRTWTSGRFSVEAELIDISQDGKTIKLRRDDNGREIAVPVEKLSKEDQDYVAEKKPGLVS
jgi:hypothetical protein